MMLSSGRSWARRMGGVRPLYGYAVAAIAGVLMPLCCGLYYLPRLGFEDTAYFGGDEWEYQSIAVNYAKGYGFPLFGEVVPFAEYKFADGNDSGKVFGSNATVREAFAAAGRAGGTPDFLRTPAYPYALGVLYHACGVAPRRAKQVQFGMLLGVVGALPLLGFAYWRWLGLVAGCVAGPLFLDRHGWLAGSLLTEPLICLSLVLMLMGLMLWEKRTTVGTSILAGVTIGLSLLVKGSFIFLVPILAIYCGVAVLKRRKKVVHVAGLFCAMALVVLPWSLYASFTVGRPILLSTQGSDLLLGGNCEKSLETGSYSDHYLSPDSFYQQARIRNLSPGRQVLAFFNAHRAAIPELVWQKIGWLGVMPFLRLALMCMVIYLSGAWAVGSSVDLRNWWIRAHTRSFWRLRAPVWVLIGGSLLLGRGVLNSLPPNLPDVRVLLLLTAALLFAVRRAGVLRSDLVPMPFGLLFLNFLAMTVIFFGYERYLAPLDSVVTLFGVYWTFRVLDILVRVGASLFLGAIGFPGDQETGGTEVTQ